MKLEAQETNIPSEHELTLCLLGGEEREGERVAACGRGHSKY